ncbi:MULTISPECIES: hypothetical protein [Nonomuraea]|uniref:Uncharacterized protein n=1 Tax=Nonomuraea mangrovi TaxID=2316207 RepID=A0ABW4T5U3_9ACTN
MRKMITALVAGGALVVTAFPAHAAPMDPVLALKAKLTPGHGVRFTEKAVLSDDKEEWEVQSRKGAFQFDKRGVAASDVTITTIDSERQRAIGVDKTTYVSGSMLDGRLPEGKTWLKTRGGGLFGFYGQIINPAEPKTLAALIKGGTPGKSTVTGTITFKELERVSPWFAASTPSSWHDGTKVSYTLTLTSAGLVSGVRSSYTATGVVGRGDVEGRTITVDSRYTKWGGKVSIKAPDPRTVTSEPLS